MRRWQAAMAVDGFSPSNKKTTKNHVYTNKHTKDLEVKVLYNSVETQFVPRNFP